MTVNAQFPDESVEGRFVRQGDAFRAWVRADDSSAYAVESGRYHLYVSLACPWAHRTIIVRALKGLEDAIGMTVVDPIRDERGWAFRDGDGYTTDPINGFAYLSEAYFATDASYRGRVTVPVLWDTRTKRIVSNSDDDIMRMFETEFDRLARHDVDLYPREHRAEIEQLNELIYQTVNDGVYQAGFAATQSAYEPPAHRVFETLDLLDARLAERRYLFGRGRDRLAAVRDAGALRRRVLRPFQVQPAPDRRLPELIGLFARPLPGARRRGDGELRPHQATLLRDARRDQPDSHRADRSAAEPRRTAPPRRPLRALSTARLTRCPTVCV